MKKLPLSAALLAGFIAASTLFAYEVGGFAYTKRLETKLLVEPKPLAEAKAKLAAGKKVKIDQVQGAWVHVSDGPAAGWVFAGNLSETKPAEGKGFDAVPLLASKTTATAAARPLSDAAVAYAQERDLGEAQADLEWMLTSSRAVTAEEVEAYLQENKRGEYQ